VNALGIAHSSLNDTCHGDRTYNHATHANRHAHFAHQLSGTDFMIDFRTAQESDADGIAELLTSLGYAQTQSFIRARITQLLAHPDEELLVAVSNAGVLGIISLHFIPQLALAGDFCRISYFCVDEEARGEGVGAALEARATELAQARGSDRIEIHCHSRRVDAHRFYNRQGYSEVPKYLVKSLLKSSHEVTNS
jgi:GNAT superfamily N-acetyltransferase